ncbi:MAG TPA: hypothetical protein VGJ72_12540 [Polaromonas sp.]
MLAVPWQHLTQATADLPSLEGRIVIDTMNPVMQPGFRLAELGGLSSSEVVAPLSVQSVAHLHHRAAPFCYAINSWLRPAVEERADPGDRAAQTRAGPVKSPQLEQRCEPFSAGKRQTWWCVPVSHGQSAVAPASGFDPVDDDRIG